MRVYGGGRADQRPVRGELGSSLKALVGSGRVTLISGFSVVRVRADGTQVIAEGEMAQGHPQGRPNRPARRNRTAPGPEPDPRVAARPRSMTGELEGARAADRTQPALLRIGAAARPPRACPSRAGLLHRRHPELRTSADLPDADGLREGSLGRGRHRRRPCRGGRHPPRATGDGCVLDQPSRRWGRSIVRVLRRCRPRLPYETDLPEYRPRGAAVGDRPKEQTSLVVVRPPHGRPDVSGVLLADPAAVEAVVRPWRREPEAAER